MNRFGLLNKLGGRMLLYLSCVMLFVSCEETYVDKDSTMPGVWLVEDIVDISSNGWGKIPFEIGDEVEFTDYGRLTVRAEEYEASGDWWVVEKFNAANLCIRMDGEEAVAGRIKNVSGGRIVWAVYLQNWEGYWDGYPCCEVTLLWEGE